MDVPARQPPLAKYWCFTINNPTDGELLPPPGTYEYMIVGKEVGADGTPHLQGYVCMKQQKRLTAMKKLMPRAHLEIAKGTPEQNRVYCSKQADFQEFGVIPPPKTANATNKRNSDYAEAVNLAKRQRIYDIDPGLLLRFGSSLRAIQKDHPLALTDNNYLCGIWMYGPPGCGKSSGARWMFPASYPKPLNKWWDGYQGEDYVLIDDIEPVHSVLGHHIKQWADHYPFTAEQKGTSIRIRPKALVITSNYTIEEIWNGTMAEAIRRRFTVMNCEVKHLRRMAPIQYASDTEESMEQ